MWRSQRRRAEKDRAQGEDGARQGEEDPQPGQPSAPGQHHRRGQYGALTPPHEVRLRTVVPEVAGHADDGAGGQPCPGGGVELPQERPGDRREREEQPGDRLRTRQSEPDRIGQHGDRQRRRRCRATGLRGDSAQEAVGHVASAPVPRRHHGHSARTAKRAHDHQHLGRDPELHDHQGEEHEPVVQRRLLRAGEHLEEVDEEQRGDDQEGDRRMPEHDRGDDGRRVAVHQRGGDGGRLPGDHAAHGDPASPGAQSRRQRQRHIGGRHRPPDPGDRAEHQSDQGPRRVGEQVGAVGHVDRVREERVGGVPQRPGRPGDEPDLLGRVTTGAGEGGRRVPRPHVPPQHEGGSVKANIHAR